MMKKNVLLIIVSLFMLSTMIAASTATPVKAAGAYDGTYDFEATIVYGPGDYRSCDFGNCFVISDSQVSNTGPDPPAGSFDGSVQSDGTISFTGPYTVTGYTHTHWTGTISGGHGSGTYYNEDASGHTSPTHEWSITLVSGSGTGGTAGSFDLTLPTLMFVFLGVALVAGIAGTVHQKQALAKIARENPDWSPKEVKQYYKQMRRRGLQKRRKPAPSQRYTPTSLGGRPYTAKPGDARTDATTPEEGFKPAGYDEARSLEASVDPPALNVRSRYTKGKLGFGQLDLNWDQPVYDKNLFQLEKYEIRKPDGTIIDRLPPDATSWSSKVRGNLQGGTLKAVYSSQYGPKYVVAEITPAP